MLFRSLVVANVVLTFVCATVISPRALVSKRDDNHRKEQPDHAKNLPIINEVPFLGNDSLPYSPPVYPTPNVSGLGYWDDAVGKARSDVEKLNLTDLVDLVTGSGWGNGPCVGNIKALSKINFKGLCLQDSPDGLRGVDRVTVFPDGITTGATFSKDLMYARGKAMGEEFRRKGAHVQLGPMVNVARAPSAGRNFEGFGADPYVNGEGAYYTTLGVQDQGVQATLKHYIANEQEHFRNSGSSNVDGRTERELYLHPFMRGIQAGAVSVMCAYNLVNNSWACQNSELLNGRLKTELNFQGYVMSDWGAQHSGVASALAGLDMTMPGQTECCEKNVTSYFWGVNLTEAVNNGTVPKSRLDDMATRVLAGYYFLHQDKDYPKTNFDFFDILDPAKNDAVDATEDHDEISRHIAAAGTVLLKNENDTLPLRKPKKLAMVGSGAAPLYEGPNRWADRVGWPYGTLGQGWGSGSVDYSYFISPYEAIQRRARKDHTAVNWCFDDYDLKTAQSVANYSDAALVFVSSLSGEGFGSVPASDGLNGNMGDRNNITLWNGGEQLIKAVTEVNNNTIVVVHSVGAVLMEDWIENPNVTAVLMAHLPGAESGNALVDVLWGEYNPSGRLPYTIAKNREDYPADVLYNSESAQPQINYTEGLLMDYRAFDKHNIEPRFAFGHGLSYTSFNYSDLSVEFVGDEVRKDDCRWNYRWGKDRAPSGLPSWIFEPMYNISFTVQNTGNRDGHEVVQVYLAFPEESGEPPLVLREFDRIWLSKGHDQRLTFSLSHYDVSTWDIAQQQWLQPNGTIYVRAGGSSRALPLKKKLT